MIRKFVLVVEKKLASSESDTYGKIDLIKFCEFIFPFGEMYYFNSCPFENQIKKNQSDIFFKSKSPKENITGYYIIMRVIYTERMH